MIKITGTTLEAFLADTKKALEQATGNKINGLSLARRFLTGQILPQNLAGQNEHSLHKVFEESPVKQDDHANIVTLSEFGDDDHSGGLVLSGNTNYVCIGTVATDKKLTELFLSNFPDSGQAASYAVESSLVQNMLDAIYDPENWTSDFTDNTEHENAAKKARKEAEYELLNQNQQGIDDYLVNTFDIHDLIEDDFFCHTLNCGLKKIEFTLAKIFR